MLKAYKFRLYPKVEQKVYLATTFGCTRFVYNKMLADRIKSYEENKDLDIKTMKYPTPATVSQVPSGKYYISILVDCENKELSKTDKKIGLDLGIKEFAITSDGEFFSNPKYLKESEKRLAKLQKDSIN